MLPEKWFIKRDNSNYRDINNYFNTGVGSTNYKLNYGYLVYPNIETFAGFKAGRHNVNITNMESFLKSKGYREISYQEFKEITGKASFIPLIFN